MKTEKINSVNRNLAEFEGLKFKTISGAPVDSLGEDLDYTKDLNLLVPIWEKSEVFTEFSFDTCRSCKKSFRHTFTISNFTGSLKFEANAETIHLAAALATEKAILALEGGK